MADTTIGKKFESKFEQYWQESVPGAFIYRLYDTVRGQSGVNNTCDYICYAQGHCFLVECKEHTKNTFPFSAFPQYERLIKYKDLEGVHAGVVLWFRDHDRVVWIPIETFTIEAWCPKCGRNRGLNCGNNIDDLYDLININVDKRYYRY